jgi:hypothetical protein
VYRGWIYSSTWGWIRADDVLRVVIRPTQDNRWEVAIAIRNDPNNIVAPWDADANAWVLKEKAEQQAVTLLDMLASA